MLNINEWASLREKIIQLLLFVKINLYSINRKMKKGTTNYISMINKDGEGASIAYYRQVYPKNEGKDNKRRL